MIKVYRIHKPADIFIARDAEASRVAVDDRVRPAHEPTFTSNVQGLTRTKVEGGRMQHRNSSSDS